MKLNYKEYKIYLMAAVKDTWDNEDFDVLTDRILESMKYSYDTGVKKGRIQGAMFGTAVVISSTIAYKEIKKFIKSRKDTVIPGTDYLANKQNDEEE